MLLNYFPLSSSMAKVQDILLFHNKYQVELDLDRIESNTNQSCKGVTVKAEEAYHVNSNIIWK